jgi:Ca2+-transporting ATPase
MPGLTNNEASELLQLHGKNIFQVSESRRNVKIIWDVIKEPMFLLLVFACLLYFILGENSEGMMMIAAIIFVSAISIYQEVKSSNALKALQELTEPEVKVIRDGIQASISVDLLVPGDLILLEEGNKVPADANVIRQNDLTVNESLVTGESLPVNKDEISNTLYQGTLINSGRCEAIVIATGSRTLLGKIGRSITANTVTATRLQISLNRFVKRFAFFGIAAFLLVFLINYINSKSLVSSLLFGLTLAMSAIPEEIPVAFSSFMALGAYHMSKLGIISRQPLTIENLGAVNIICLDKTGTITENKMTVHSIYDHASSAVIEMPGIKQKNSEVLYYGLLASEEDPFDAMERAIVEAYKKADGEMPGLKIKTEYPLGGNPPMMTHVYDVNGSLIVASKGAVERIIKVCGLGGSVAEKILEISRSFAIKGQRVLGIAGTQHDGPLPPDQENFNWQFKGLISLYDPPRPFVKNVLGQFYDAGINIKLLTGDFPETAMSIAKQTGIHSPGKFYTGNDILSATENELHNMVNEVNIFARMFPEAKMKVIHSLMHQGNIVAMTGDGVNDGPALKAANIGIAMGKRGTEVARQSAGLIITDDDLRKVAEAIRQGRKIFINIKKAIRYIISIHIPIILTASVPLLLGWKYPNIFTPIHIIFLELIMGPTCSVFYEREPVESNVMKLPPAKKESLFRKDEVGISVLQGITITIGILVLYLLLIRDGYSLEAVRTMVFTTLILSNIFLTFVNRSFTNTFSETIRYKNNLVVPVLAISPCFLLLIHLVTPLRQLFGLDVISFQEFIICFLTSFISVAWFEIYKTELMRVTRLRNPDHKQMM